MSRLLFYLGRCVVIFFGFLCASLAASAFLHLLVVGGLDLHGEGELDPGLTFSFLFSIPFLALFVGYWSFLPAFVLIVIAEIARLRGWLFHVAAGVAAAAAGGFLRPGGDALLAARQSPDFALSIVAAGIVGGGAYWLVAGRSAGIMPGDPDAGAMSGDDAR